MNNENNPFSPAVSTEVFEAHMSYLARHYKVVGMDELSRHLESGDSTEAVVGITFDDGYLDNYECALPILKRYNLPATIFLTTGHIDSGELLWFEQLAEAVRGTSREYIDLEIDIPRRFWMRTERERLDANAGVFRLLRVMSDGDRRTWLVEVLDQLDAKSCARKSRMLSWDQVRSMKTSRIDFGGHTVTHPFLSKLTGERAAWEVAECKRRIEEELQSPVGFFAYPNGREEDFTASSKEILRRAGYHAAVTTIWGMNYRSTDRMELRRGGPWEENPGLFSMKLDWYRAGEPMSSRPNILSKGLSMFTARDREKCEQIYDRYYRGRKFHDSLYRDLIRKHLLPGQRVLDAGCGRYLRFCKELSDTASVVGIDLDSVLETDNHAAPFAVRGDVSRLPFPSGHFDMVISRSVVEHLEEPAKVFQEFARVLKPGGKAVIITPNKYDYVSVIAALTPYKVHRSLVSKIFQVPEDDVFPTSTGPTRSPQLQNYSAGLVQKEPGHLYQSLSGVPDILTHAFPRMGILYERITGNAPFRSLRGSTCVCSRSRRSPAAWRRMRKMASCEGSASGVS